MCIPRHKLAIRNFAAKCFLIYPFLTILGFVDFFISLLLPYKYKDPKLPNKHEELTVLSDKNDPSSAYRSKSPCDFSVGNDDNIYNEFAKSVYKYANFNTLGVRELFSIDDDIQPNGKIFKKLSLGSYKWTTYEMVLKRVNNLSNGLLKIGLKSNDSIMLFAETRPEWLISALACFRVKAPVVTLYSTLGIDALAYGINQTNASMLLTSGDQLPKIQKILTKVKCITHIVVIGDKFNEKSIANFRKQNSDRLTVYTTSELETIGLEANVHELIYSKPGKDDIAVIMYTSGSTGNPKGVMISHLNLITSLKTVIKRLGTIKLEKDIYIAYLPLAHVLELCCELGCLLNGIRVAYSSPQTIADNSTAIKKGQKGDLRVLKPTIMAAVPVVLERLSKTVYEKLSTTSWLKQLFFQHAYKQKLLYYRYGYSTPLLDRVLFKRINNAVVGGKLRLLVCGGALLSREVHEFAQVCLSPVMQAYGLTETCSSALSQLPNQTDTGTVGSVIPCSEIRLVDWPEAGYRCTDKPNPRGEIYIGGNNVAVGYYNMPEKTASEFIHINGVRYFKTGDIGEMLANGNMKIIDRKKDLVKLSGGEYVALNKVESILKLLTFIDNCCVIAQSGKSECICLICPNNKKLVEYLSGNDQAKRSSIEQRLVRFKTINEKVIELKQILDEDPDTVSLLHSKVLEHCLKQGLEKFETPKKLIFVKEIWTPDTGLVTDSLKLKRREIQSFYMSEISSVYN